MDQNSPYQPPAADPSPPIPQPLTGEPPKVILWYKIYLGILGVMYACVAAAGIFLFVAPISADDLDDMEPKLMGGIYTVIGIVMLIPVIVGFFLPRSKGAWIFHLVMICIGMSGCTIAGCIPLLIFWIKPEVKDYFERKY